MDITFNYSIQEQLEQQIRDHQARVRRTQEANAGILTVGPDNHVPIFAQASQWGNANVSSLDEAEPTFAGIRAMNLLHGRLRMDADALRRIGFTSMVVRRASGQIVVFAILKGQALVLHDDEQLFPSDELVGKLRALL